MGQTDILTLKGKFTACQKMLISDKMKLTPPAVSHHMQILKDAGVVHCRKEGKYMYYFLDSSGKDIDKLLELFTQMKEMLARR